ncbi:MAG: hypothetical protein WCQ50_05925 [Spirochaetota bacterium]
MRVLNIGSLNKVGGDSFLEGWCPGDAVLLQNEISHRASALEEALRRGLRGFLTLGAEGLSYAGSDGIAAAALCVTRAGAVPSIPYRNEIS